MTEDGDLHEVSVDLSRVTSNTPGNPSIEDQYQCRRSSDPASMCRHSESGRSVMTGKVVWA